MQALRWKSQGAAEVLSNGHVPLLIIKYAYTKGMTFPLGKSEARQSKYTHTHTVDINRALRAHFGT